MLRSILPLLCVLLVGCWPQVPDSVAGSGDSSPSAEPTPTFAPGTGFLAATIDGNPAQVESAGLRWSWLDNPAGDGSRDLTICATNIGSASAMTVQVIGVNANEQEPITNSRNTGTPYAEVRLTIGGSNFTSDNATNGPDGQQPVRSVSLQWNGSDLPATGSFLASACSLPAGINCVAVTQGSFRLTANEEDANCD